MSHKFESGFFVKTPAWHGLGNLLAGAPSIDEAIKQAGLDWTVSKHPMFLADGTLVPDMQATRRDSDGSLLGCVGAGSSVLQNVKAFDQFRPLVDSGEITLEAAGSLNGGRRIWILGAVKDGTAEVNPGDEIKQYVLLAHAHDGSLAIRFGFTAIRVVCQNTLSAAIGSDADSLQVVKHTKNMLKNLDKARANLDFARRGIKLAAEQGRYLSRKGIDQTNLVRYVRAVLSSDPKAIDQSEPVRNEDKVLEAFESAPGQDMPGARGTLWGAYNAVTYYATHERGQSQETRQNANWFGTGGQLAAKALTYAMQFAEGAPDVAYQSRQAASNTATAAATFAELLGTSIAPKPDTSASDLFSSLLDRPVAPAE